MSLIKQLLEIIEEQGQEPKAGDLVVNPQKTAITQEIGRIVKVMPEHGAVEANIGGPSTVQWKLEWLHSPTEKDGKTLWKVKLPPIEMKTTKG